MCFLLPSTLTHTDSQTEIIVALKEDGKEPEDEKRRFKIVLNMVNKVDLETIVGFSKGEAQSAQVREETVSFRVLCTRMKLMYSTLLFRLVTSFSDRILMRSTPTSVLLVEGSLAKVS
jgi:hypothetical protein